MKWGLQLFQKVGYLSWTSLPWTDLGGQDTWKRSYKNAKLGSFLISPPLFLRATMVQGVQKASWFRYWEIRITAQCKLCLSISLKDVCVWLHPRPMGMDLPQWLWDENLPAGGEPQPQRTTEHAHVQPACGLGGFSRISAKKQQPAVLPSLGLPFPANGSFLEKEAERLVTF